MTLFHKHGGRITSIDAITHTSTGRGRNRSGYVEFVGRVEWSDGTVSTKANIAPILICTETGDATPEYLAVMGALNAYMKACGELTERGNWLPHKATGRAALAVVAR